MKPQAPSIPFKAQVIPSGNASAVEVPEAVLRQLGSEARPAIRITINGHQWRSRIAAMRGMRLIGISAANRAASGIALGDQIEVTVALDTEPRDVDLPPDLAAALAKAKALPAFEKLPFGLRRKHVADIDAAKAEATRQRRIDKLVSGLKA